MRLKFKTYSSWHMRTSTPSLSRNSALKQAGVSRLSHKGKLTKRPTARHLRFSWSTRLESKLTLPRCNLGSSTTNYRWLPTTFWSWPMSSLLLKSSTGQRSASEQQDKESMPKAQRSYKRYLSAWGATAMSPVRRRPSLCRDRDESCQILHLALIRFYSVLTIVSKRLK